MVPAKGGEGAVHDVTQLRQRAVDRLNKLSPSRLLETLDSMTFLLNRTSPTTVKEPAAPLGSPEDRLARTGFYVEPGELKEML